MGCMSVSYVLVVLLVVLVIGGIRISILDLLSLCRLIGGSLTLGMNTLMKG